MEIKPTYCDLHIHTFPDANKREGYDYDHEILIAKVLEASKGAPALISLTDHNTINAAAYKAVLSMESELFNLVLGVEVHVKSNGPRPYHSHMYFNVAPDDEAAIAQINEILDGLYPDKLPSLDSDIPKLPDILNAFRKYDFLFLPHGGQSHSTFDEAVEEGELFDDLMMLSTYHNTFDGFTARSASNVEKTERYFERIGISEFTNLLTGSDNYNPADYPRPKAEDAEAFSPTWIFSAPTFDGLRLALSEKTRLRYSAEEPEGFSDLAPSVVRVKLGNDVADIDVDLSAGLNVVIGGSSSGKTLFAETIARSAGALADEDKNSCYDKFGIDEADVVRGDNATPYYINQSYISKVVDKAVDHETIESIKILRDVFPDDPEAYEESRQSFSRVRSLILDLFSAAKDAQAAKENLGRYRHLVDLLTTARSSHNPVVAMIPGVSEEKKLAWNESKYTAFISALDDLVDCFDSNPLLDSLQEPAKALKEEVARGKEICGLSESVLSVLKASKKDYESAEEAVKDSDRKKEEDFEAIVASASRFVDGLDRFSKTKGQLLTTSFGTKPKTKSLTGHTLSVTYSFEMSGDLLLKIINGFVLDSQRFQTVEEITAETLLLSKVDRRKKIASLDQWATKVAAEIESNCKREFAIKTSSGKDWAGLSEGRKTAVLLDLILGYKGNTAPLIIDQPEDNLASDYINEGLAKAIQGSKSSRQTIVVTHNATIPMLADAQTVVLCRQIDGGKLLIRSAPLEGLIDGKRMLDWIAEITDGGKQSVQKRFRKYNFRHFEGGNDER